MDLGQYKGMEEEGFWFEMQDDETSNMKAFFHYNIQSQGELDIIQDFMNDSYTPPEDAGPDLNDLLDGLGISLN